MPMLRKQMDNDMEIWVLPELIQVIRVASEETESKLVYLKEALLLTSYS